ncbi:MAG TPA: C40 family peptidase [Candidatus Thiothrix moscowensis]|uniref:C40 family peptidase n=1 Tax=unclassified Thiothrix TaxID=2636184 RepID=UPI001A1BF2CB|nr:MULTISPECIES: C40 family peptidase [unclassified Thiothrix]MBJ6611124.1 C40 family peptidase [Candidatus Thiothrix moscowensis]HRJ52356.1 C40 family peptidase [Candidatus Thiothrix moscowensis]HRJ92671.1 C40 family peptidase [Candidatus Thiothrix moscowensis]
MSSGSVKTFALCSVGVVALVLSGCSAENTKTSDASNSGKYAVQLAHAKSRAGVGAVTKLPTKGDVTLLDRVVWNAQKQQGKMYQWGGESPATGFDCSGLTQYAFGKGAGVSLPRTAAAQYDASVKIPKASADKGDLVFFNTRGRRIGHVGIYLGDNKFVHAPRTGKAITTDKLEGYWGERLVGFGRIPGACKPALS